MPLGVHRGQDMSMSAWTWPKQCVHLEGWCTGAEAGLWAEQDGQGGWSPCSEFEPV